MFEITVNIIGLHFRHLVFSFLIIWAHLHLTGPLVCVLVYVFLCIAIVVLRDVL